MTRVGSGRERAPRQVRVGSVNFWDICVIVIVIVIMLLASGSSTAAAAAAETTSSHERTTRADSYSMTLASGLHNLTAETANSLKIFVRISVFNNL